MAITSEIIGKLGGAEVESTPVSMSGSGSGTRHLLTRVEVPEAKQVLVALIGSFSTTVTGSRAPELQIGSAKNVTSGTVGVHSSMAAVLAAPGDVSVVTNSAGEVHFSGAVYVTEM